VPVDVGVQDAHLLPGRSQRRGQIHRHRGLADPALAAGNSEHPGQRRGLGEGDLLFRAPSAQLALEFLALLLAHHIQVDLDPGHARQLADRRGHVPGDGIAQRAAGHGQVDIDPDHAALAHGDVLDHPELGDRTVDLGIVDPRQGLRDLLGGGGRGNSGRHDHALMLRSVAGSVERGGVERGGV
jgi:hypothetical protein